MNSSTTTRTIDAALPCAPVTVLPHAVAHATLPVTYAGVRGLVADRPGADPFRVERFRPVGVEVRHGGQVSRPEGAALAMIAGPAVEKDKSTAASVPGRRGGT